MSLYPLNILKIHEVGLQLCYAIKNAWYDAHFSRRRFTKIILFILTCGWWSLASQNAESRLIWPTQYKHNSPKPKCILLWVKHFLLLCILYSLVCLSDIVHVRYHLMWEVIFHYNIKPKQCPACLILSIPLSFVFCSLSLQPCLFVFHGSNNMKNLFSLLAIKTPSDTREGGSERERNKEKGSGNRISQTSWLLFEENKKNIVCLFVCVCMCMCVCETKRESTLLILATLVLHSLANVISLYTLQTQIHTQAHTQ